MKLSFSIKYNLFTLFQSPGIYAWKRGDKYLYIGQSDFLIRRLTTHNIINKVERFKKGDKLEIYTFPVGTDGWTMIKEEDTMIDKYKPIYSVPVFKYGMDVEKKERTCPMCKKKFMQKRYWQKYCSRECNSGCPK